jgi:hypothetical protein
MRRGLDSLEVCKYPAAELDAIAVREVGDDIVAEARTEGEDIIAFSSGERVVARSDAGLEPTTAASSPPAERVRNRHVTMMATQSPRRHHRVGHNPQARSVLCRAMFALSL